jgi:hypothetical protein
VIKDKKGYTFSNCLISCSYRGGGTLLIAEFIFLTPSLRGVIFMSRGGTTLLAVSRRGGMVLQL